MLTVIGTPSLTLPPPPPLIPALGLPAFSSPPTGPVLLPSIVSSLPITNAPPASPISSTVNIASMLPSPPAIISNPLANFPGIPAVPQKLVQKITSREYFDLADLLPDQLLSSPSTSTNTLVVLPESAYATHRRKKRQIPDIATWVQVYSTYTLILGSAFPNQLPELIAYQLLIVQHSIKFQYPSWLRYDVDFRQWAASNGFHSWSQIHPQFYAFAFTAQGKANTWCPICYTDGGNHTYDCPKFAIPPTPAPSRPSLLQQPTFRPSLPLPPFPAGSQRFTDARPPPPKRPSPDHCILYNKNNGNCPYGERCIKIHMCAFCKKRGHPVSQCTSKST